MRQRPSTIASPLPRFVLLTAMALLLAAPAAFADQIGGEETDSPGVIHKGAARGISQASFIGTIIPYAELQGLGAVYVDTNDLTFGDSVGATAAGDQTTRPGVLSPVSAIDRSLLETDLAHLGQPAFCPDEAPCAPKPPALAPSTDSAASGPDYGRTLRTFNALSPNFGAFVEYDPGQVEATGAASRDGLYLGPEGYAVFKPFEVLQDLDGPDFVVVFEVDDDPRPGDDSPQGEAGTRIFAWDEEEGSFQFLAELDGVADFSSRGLAYYVFDLDGIMETDQILVTGPSGPGADLGAALASVEAMQPDFCWLECNELYGCGDQGGISASKSAKRTCGSRP